MCDIGERLMDNKEGRRKKVDEAASLLWRRRRSYSLQNGKNETNLRL
jgi:hypothetical protein